MTSFVLGLVNDIKDIAEAYIEFETKRSEDTFKTFEEKYNAIVKEYNDAEPGLYDRPVPGMDTDSVDILLWQIMGDR